MHLTVGTIKLKVPKDSNSIILNNLYLSCDPYVIFKMMNLERQLTDPYILCNTPNSCPTLD
ncbi:hypothetical protein Gotur_027674 [Gossypium turneri]